MDNQHLVRIRNKAESDKILSTNKVGPYVNQLINVRFRK